MTGSEPLDPVPDPPAHAGSPSAGTFGLILQNILTMGSSKIFTMASSVVLALVLPRFLGDVNLGKFAFAVAYTGFFGLATNLGIGTYLTKEVARNPSRMAAYAQNAIIVRLPMAALAAVLGITLINLLGYDELTRRTVYVLFLNMTLMTIYDIVLASFQGLQEMRPLAVSQVVLKIVNSALVTGLLITGHGPIEVAIASGLSVGIGLAVALLVYPGRVKLHVSIEPSLWRALVLGGLPFFVWKASNVVYARVDILMLSAFAHDAVIGWYSTAYRIISIYGFIPVIIMTVVFPALSVAATKDLREFNTIARRAMQAVLIGTVPIAVGTILLSDKLMGLLYPPEFSRSVPILVILALNIPLVGADMIIGTALIARDKQRQWAMVGISAAFFNPAMNVVLIPLTQSAYGNGAIGAATATLLTAMYLMAMGLRLLPRGVFDSTTLSTALRTVGAALLMAGPVWITRDMPIVVPVAVGVVVYSGSCLLLRAVVVRDLRRAWSYFVHRQQARASAPTGG